MRKMSNVKKAAILASVLGGCVFAGSAMAANLLVTVPSNYGSSNMAVITGSRVTDRIDSEPNRAVMTSLNRDPAAYSFVMDGKNKFILRQYTYDTIDLLPMILVDADTDWPKDGYISGTISKGANPHAAAGHNGYVYTGDYDLGTIAVAKVTNNALVEDLSKTRYLLEDINKYCEGDLDVSEGAWTHGESLLVKGNQLFAVVSVNATGGNTSYSSGYLLQYDIQADGSLKFVSFTRTGRNTDTVKLNSYNNLLINTAIGGMQNYGYGNNGSNVTIGVLNGGKLNDKNEVNASIVPENIKKFKLDFRDICVWPNGTAYILAYNLDGSGRGGSTFNIYKTTVANLNSTTPKDWEIVVQDKTDGGGNTGVKTGWFNKIFAEYYTKRLWGEFGDNIVVYLDGDNNPSYTWSAYNLAGNSDYHTFNSVTQLAGDDVVGGLALLTKSREEGLTTPSATTSTIININANVKKADYQNRITGTTNDTIYSNITPDNSNYTFEGDKTISLNELAWKTQADLSNNILAAVYAHDGNDITVNAGSNTLQLQVQNSIATPVGVYAGNGKNVTINADKLNIITIGAVDGNSLNNAIMNDAGKSAASKITVNGDVNISMSGGYGGNGVAIQKTDRWGEASYASDVANTITINGNLTVKGTDSETWGIPINADNVLSRFNNAGILTQVENSRVDVSGTADMDVYGNGITTNAKNSTVSIGGGEINVPKGMNYGYYTLGAYQGTINVNTGKDGTAAGNNSVKLGGDIFALPTGTVNVALTTGDSYLRGIVDNGGTVNMWLQNGASWINQANNTRYAQDNEDVGSNGASHISKLTGGSKDAAGVIFQKSGSKDITIDKYSGNTMVIYEHDNNNPENILGGNFTVKTAENGSAVVLRTDSSGVNTSSEATVNKVLDALANKLYYTDYVSGSRNLDGQVQIAEGLTAASAAQYIGNIEYSSTSGQGRLGEKITTQLEVPKGDNVENNKNFLVENDSWHGNNSGDKVNLTLKDKASWTGDNSGSNMVVKASDSIWTGDNKGEGLNVTLNTSSWEGDNEGGAAVIELKNKSNWSGDNSGNNANIVIDDSTWNGENIGKDAIITVRNNGSWNKDVKINNTKLTVDSASYNGHIVSDSNTINVQNSAQWSGNVNGKNNIITIQDAKWSGNNSGDSSTIDLLNAKWNGNSFGKDTKVAINSGSVWEGYNSGAGFDLKMASGSTWVITADSVVENLSSNLGRAGGTNPTIDMTNCAANATIGNYNGNFTLLYKHDYTNPSQLQGGSFTINKAMDGSTITLLTDSSGIKLNDEDSVNDTLNALANKLYYQEAIDGKQNLSGSVKIVESLTAPEISKQAGSIIYNSTNGQGMLDVNSVAPGFTYPKMQDKFVFNTTLTGDYKMDKEYRQHGVLTADNNIYEFPLDPSNSSLNEKTTIVPENGNAISVNQDTTITMGRSYDLYLNAQKAPNIIVNNAKLNIFAGTVYTGRDEILTYDYKTRNEYQPGVIVNNGSLKIEGNLAAYGKVDDVEPVITINGKDSSVEITKSLSIAAGRVVQYGDKEDFSNKAEVAVLADGGKLLVKSGVNISGSLHATNEGNIELRSGDGMTVMGDLIADKNAKIKLVSNQGNIYNVDLDSNVSTDATGEVILDFTNSGLLKNKWEGDNNGNTQLVMGNGEWRGNNNGNITASLVNSSTWTGTNNGANATVNLTDSSWSGDNSGAGLSLTADNSKWNGSTSAAGSATLTNGSSWTGASTSADFALTLNGSTWNNSGASSLKSFAGTNGIVDMTNAAASVTIGSYSGDATVIYKHNSSNPAEVHGGNFTVNKAAANSKITMLTDNTGVDTTDEDKINEALDALAGKLFYTGAIGGAENNLNGTVKIAEGLTATSVAKQTAGIVYDKTTGQGSADHKTVTPGPVYPSEQDRTAFVTSITGEHLTDKEYRKAGVLSNTVDNNIYNFTKDATTITTDSSAITTAKDTTLKLNSHDLTITANGGDGIATSGGKLTVQNAGSLTVSGAKAINANNSKVDITAVNATLNGDVSTNNVVNIKATKAAKVNGAVSASGANSSVSINGTASAAISGAVSANGANTAVTIDSADTIIGSDITANGKGAKVTAKNLSKLNGNVATDADGSVELNFKEGASWTGDNSGNTTMSLSKGIWNGANTGKLNATLTNGTTWTGDSSGAGSTIKLDASSWSGMNSGKNANVTLTNGASWSKGNTADGVTVKADKSTWTGVNSGANANITLGNASTWTGANNGANATVNLTDSSWSGDNSGANVTITANNSKWNGNANAAGSAVLTNGSIWTGASTSADFSLTLNGSTWNNSGASSLKSFTGTNGVVDMTNAAASVTIGSYSGDATVIYKHNSSNPAEVHGGNFTVNKAAANSKITMLTDNTGVDTTDEDKINEALDALAGKLFYTGAIGGAENNLNGTVKIAEGLTATSVAKQTAGIVYDKTTGQGSADHKTVTPGPVYPTEQDRTAFVTSITGEHFADKEYRKAGVLSNTVDNNIYNFTKDATTITTDSSAITTAKDTTLKLNNHDLTITANSGDGIATSGGTLTVQDAGNLTVKGAKAINANNSKVDITAVNATLNGDVTTNNVVNIKATKAAKVNGTVNANGANSSVSIRGTASAAISGAVSADGTNAAVTIDSADTIIGSDITANGKGAKVTAKNLSKLNGNVATDADGSVELNFKEGASWTGDNSGNTTMSLSKGIWNGANTGKLNATLTNGTTWTGDSSGAGSTIKLDASSWSGMNSGKNANVTLTNGASWSKGNTADGVTVKADKSTWTGVNSGANANITLGNASTWTGANNGANATVNLTDSSWSGDNSGANVTITANNSKWNGNANAAGSAVLTNGSIWTGASTSGNFSLTLNNSTWNNSGASSLKSFNATNGIVDMTNAAASVTIGSYSGDATVIYKHNSSNPAEVHGGNFTVNKAAANSKITMLTDNTGVDTTDEDKINEALDALAGKLFYTGAIGGAENNLNGTVKIAEGLTATSVAKQTAGIVYDKTTGQGSADHKTVTPGPVYPSEQDRTAFVTSITGEHLTDKEYRKAGVLSNTVDNNIYNFTKDTTTITTAGSAVTTAKDTTLKLNNHDLTITASSGDGIVTTGGTLTVQDAGNLTVKGAKAINANNSKVDITAVNATLNGDVTTNNVVNIKATKAAKVNGAVSVNGANAAVTIDSADTTIGSDITANGKGAKVTAKNLSKLDGDVTTDADGSVELNFKEGASWSGDNSGNTTMSLSKGTWNGANTGKLNATLTNGTTWTGDSSGAGSTIKLDASTWNGANSGANADITLKNGASWSKGNTADGVTVKADKAAWTGANGGAKANITLSNSASWNGANTGSNATVNLTDSSWTGDNSGAGLSLTANNSKWNGSTSTAGSAVLTNGSIWNGASTSADFSLTLNGSTWNNSGASSLKSFTGTNGVVDMTNAAAGVTIGSYSGDATVIYKHNSSNPAEVHGGNFTVNKAAANSKITMLTDRSGVDFSDEDSIANALNSLANKLYYTGYITGERNLTGYVKLAEGLTASSVIKQTGDISYDKTTGQGSLKDGSVTPNVTYPEEQTKDNFTSQITGEWKQDKEYKLAGVLHTDNAVYDFSKDRSIITTAGTSVGAGRDLQLQLNNKSMSLNSGADAVKADAITIEFKNLDKLDIKATGQALLAENGGKIILHNTGAVTADSAFIANGAGSSIKADGLTNITVGSGDAVKADAGSIELAGGTVKGNVTADNKGKISINANNNAAGSILTDITGNVLATAGSSVDIGLGTADSKLTGDVSTAGDAVINIYADMGIWTGNADGDNVNLNLNSSKAQWNNIGNSKLRSLKGNGGIVNQTDANAGNIDVGDYSGNVVVNYKHTADKDTASNTLNNIKFGGGSLNIDKAAEGSSITLRTDNSDNLSYTETDNIEKLFRELSKKLYYADAGSNPDNLSGHVEIAEGLTKVKVYGDINYGEHGQGNYKDGSIKRTDPEIIYGSSETAMMRGAKSAMASTALLWRSENSDMLQRMGDVRLANEESGLWARYYGGKNSFDAKNTKYSTSFNAYQLGYDKQLDNNKLFGAAVSYNKGKNTYEMGGHGDGKAVSLAVYGSWNSDKGHYADVIVKGGKLDNDYTVYNDMGHKLEGDYDTWGLSLSAEYGRRMQMQNGFYIDPSVQFTVGRIAGADYSAASDFLDSKGLKKDMYVSQDAFTSAIGRIGLGMGKTTDKAMFYTKFALAHEFSGDFTTTFAAENEPTSSTAVDFGGTWFEWQLGGSMKVNDNSYVYATFEKKFGGDTGSNDWRLDAGLRWSF